MAMLAFDSNSNTAPSRSAKSTPAYSNPRVFAIAASARMARGPNTPAMSARNSASSARNFASIAILAVK